jgi:hypothetical protein
MPRSDRKDFGPLVSPDTALGACPSWPVMFSLPPRGEQALVALRRYRVPERTGTYATPRAILSAVILHMPEDVALIVTLSNHSPAAGPLPPPGTMADVLRRRTHVQLPAPLSLRLNRLIAVASEETGQRCSRTAVIVSLMRMAQLEEKDLWRRRFEMVFSQRAQSAVPERDRANPETVLRLIRPNPGPRPQVLAAPPGRH